MKVTQDSGYYNYWNNINTKSDKKRKKKSKLKYLLLPHLKIKRKRRNPELM